MFRSSKYLLPCLLSPENYCDFCQFCSDLGAVLALKIGGDVLENLQLSPLPRKQSANTPRKLRENSEKIRDENSKMSESFRSVTFLTF